MKISKKILLLISFATFTHNQIFTINLKQILSLGLCAQSINGECTVYNTMEKDVTIQNSRYNLLNGLSLGMLSTETVPLSEVTISAKSYQSIPKCIHLDVVPSTEEGIKYKSLLDSDQPHDTSRAFVVSEESCIHDCQGATTQINLTPGLPSSYFSHIETLSPKELIYAADQLRRNPSTVTHKCNPKKLRGLKK